MIDVNLLFLNNESLGIFGDFGINPDRQSWIKRQSHGSSQIIHLKNRQAQYLSIRLIELESS
jgi:hypothetical protein